MNRATSMLRTRWLRVCYTIDSAVAGRLAADFAKSRRPVSRAARPEGMRSPLRGILAPRSTVLVPVFRASSRRFSARRPARPDRNRPRSVLGTTTALLGTPSGPQNFWGPMPGPPIRHSPGQDPGR